MKTIRTISIGYNEFMLPEDITRKELSDLVATVAALRPIDSHGRKITDEWTSVYYLGDMRVTTGTRTIKELLADSEQATKHLDHLERQAMNPEGAF